MVFFDFNIPFVEGISPSSETQDKMNHSNTFTRVRLVVKAMELGYTGIAYNRSIRGVMADTHRCNIPLLPLKSLLQVAPALSQTVKFHREILGVSLNSPFRQYTRLTVAVDSLVQAATLNSGNPILKTYDLVAVQPLNQVTFDQACKQLEVDLISIDFNQKLPFRLKVPMVKAAIQRGIYFEIIYSDLISDVRARREILAGAKLLIDWTRGKNLIISSGSRTVNELRGPYDVANLLTLFGLSMDKAKAAVSKNCRSLISKALRKKQCYQGAIRVERIYQNEVLDPTKAWLVECNTWDPISSGEGDLILVQDFSICQPTKVDSLSSSPVTKRKQASSRKELSAPSDNIEALITLPQMNNQLNEIQHVKDQKPAVATSKGTGFSDMATSPQTTIFADYVSKPLVGDEEKLLSPIYKAVQLPLSETRGTCQTLGNDSVVEDMNISGSVIEAPIPEDTNACKGLPDSFPHRSREILFSFNNGSSSLAQSSLPDSEPYNLQEECNNDSSYENSRIVNTCAPESLISSLSESVRCLGNVVPSDDVVAIGSSACDIELTTVIDAGTKSSCGREDVSSAHDLTLYEQLHQLTHLQEHPIGNGSHTDHINASTAIDMDQISLDNQKVVSEVEGLSSPVQLIQSEEQQHKEDLVGSGMPLLNTYKPGRGRLKRKSFGWSYGFSPKSVLKLGLFKKKAQPRKKRREANLFEGMTTNVSSSLS
ncbi:hypothetical protein AMTRI_Chr07g25490 [Amborella trichopoda]|uniref:Uncharacterized protein n=1 Tax=Amborella trichopoda TaxID=13333 RepID=U5D389_AMBTC|nr:uncharacterized protein LOC18444181 [Amborella trichopoda]ERN15887.1 hypothetical protein AMTR_s00039p00206760 [Amborella trichopoda]|eukprot:XP_006854420.1 uncharacterized protein LOC18444181 [Amborella trichopoda]